jgi:succinate dehydrogenase/fumarate reductase cytochrome b subunit
VVIGLPLSKLLVHILTESWWFDAISFSEVFPLYEDVRTWLLVLFFCGLTLSALVYALKGKNTLDWGWENILTDKAAAGKY